MRFGGILKHFVWGQENFVNFPHHNAAPGFVSPAAVECSPRLAFVYHFFQGPGGVATDTRIFVFHVEAL